MSNKEDKIVTSSPNSTSSPTKMDLTKSPVTPTRSDHNGEIVSLRRKSKSEQKLTSHARAPPLNPIMRTCSNPNYGYNNVHLFNMNSSYNSPAQSPEPCRRRLSEFSFSDR